MNASIIPLSPLTSGTNGDDFIGKNTRDDENGMRMYKKKQGSAGCSVSIVVVDSETLRFTALIDIEGMNISGSPSAERL